MKDLNYTLTLTSEELLTIRSALSCAMLKAEDYYAEPVDAIRDLVKVESEVRGQYELQLKERAEEAGD